MAVHLITREGAGELRVETGIGRVTKVERAEGKRNARVVIDADHLREDVTGWVDTQGPTWPRVQAASAGRFPVRYTIEVHRTRGVEISTPLAQLGNRQKVRDLVALDMPSDPERPLDGTAANGAQPAAAAPDPAPVAAGPPAAPPPAPEPAAAPDMERAALTWHALQLARYQEVLRAATGPLSVTLRDAWRRVCTDAGASREHVLKVEAAAASTNPVLLEDPDVDDARRATRRTSADGPDPDDPWATPPPGHDQHGLDVAAQVAAGVRDPDGVTERAPAPGPMSDDPPPAPSSGPRVSRTSGLSRRALPVASDSRPWDYMNTDGRVNLSSYAAGAVMEMTKLAGQLLVTRMRNRADEDPSYELTAPTPEQVSGLASTLLLMADTVQYRMREGGRVDRMAASHRLARNAMRDGLDLYPVPWGVEEDERKEWMRAVVGYASTLLTVTLDILEPAVAPPAEADAS